MVVTVSNIPCRYLIVLGTADLYGPCPLVPLQLRIRWENPICLVSSVLFCSVSLLFGVPTAINSIVTLIYTLLLVWFTLLKNHKGILAWLILTLIQIVLETVWVVWVIASYMLYDSMTKWIFAIFILNLSTRVATFIVAKLYYSEIKYEATERKQEVMAP